MITCNLMGGLGNQLFQIFHTIACALKSNNNFIFLNTTELNFGKKRYTYWHSFLSKLQNFLVKDIPNSRTIREIDFKYHEIPLDLLTDNNITLFGYFQSHKYFEKYYKKICKLIDLDNNKLRLLQKINTNDIYNKNYNIKNTISLHFRLGDYKNIQHYHPIMPYEYYKNSLEYFNKINNINYNIIYFCENDDIELVMETIKKLKEDFQNYTFERGLNTLEDWEQMLYMSCCEHNIIANSSFSWWGAYFNSNKDKVVCYPSIWFGPSANNDVSDLCPNEWIKISCE